MLPKTPMLATATDWSGPTSSDAQVLQVRHDLRGLPHEVDLEPEPGESLLELGQEVGQLVLEVRGVVDELVDRRGQGGRRLHQDRQQHHDDREVDDDHGAGLGQPRDQPRQPVDQRQQGEREQPGEEEQQQDVAERVEHGGDVPEHDEPEGDHREDERGVDQPPLALRQAVEHGVSLHVWTRRIRRPDPRVRAARGERAARSGCRGSVTRRGLRGGRDAAPGTIASPTAISPSTRMSARIPALWVSARMIGRPTRPSR